MKTRKHCLSAAGLALLLAACGGGGGSGGEDPPPPSTYTLSGSIGVIETSAVDSDLNDPTQKDPAGGYQTYRINDSLTTAQSISTPVLLVGTVNEAATGPNGNNSQTDDTVLHDQDDFYLVELTAGQVVELEFAADPADSDVDLYLYDAAGQFAGASTGEDTRYECVTISRSGSYYVNPYAYRNASIYSLRVGAPGTASSCATATAAFGTAALLARPHDTGSAKALSRSAAAAHQGLLGQAGVTLEARNGLGPQWLRLPTGAAQRRAGLGVLAGRGSSSDNRSVRALGSSKSALSHSEAAPGTAQARIEAMATTLRYAKRLRSSGAYAYVEPDWILQTTATIGAFPPDDRYYGYQRWHYEQIRLPEAINRINALTSQPTQRPIVAVIDSGVVLDHPDLAPQLLSNGRSFVGGTSSASGDDQSGPADNSVFHGSHVAGTIAASTYDGHGAAGVAPMAQILPVNVFGAGAGASTSDIVNGILYAAGLPNSSGFVPARRADVINMSLGGSGSCAAAFQNAVTQARAAGVIVVAATGNDGATSVGQPANCSGVIAVSATQADKGIAPYSNTGSAVKVAAPGGNTGQSTTGTGQPDGVFSTMASFNTANTRVSTLGFLQGTSMASPHVAGVMALMRYINPALTPAQVDSLLSAGSLGDDLGSSGWDSRYGHGLINADKAVVAALASRGTPVPTPAGQVAAEPSSLDFGSFQTTGKLTLAYSGASSERVTAVTSSNTSVLTVTRGTVDANGLGSYNLAVNRASLPTGTAYLSLTVSLASGSRASFQVPVAVSKGAGGFSRARGFGPVYVLLQDPDDESYTRSTIATFSDLIGAYRWSYSGYDRAKVVVIAGTDLDNDGYICQRGEACGGYPVLEAVIDGQAVSLTGNRSDLNFQAAPLSGISAQSTTGPGAARGVRRPPQP